MRPPVDHIDRCESEVVASGGTFTLDHVVDVLGEDLFDEDDAGVERVLIGFVGLEREERLERVDVDRMGRGDEVHRGLELCRTSVDGIAQRAPHRCRAVDESEFAFATSGVLLRERESERHDQPRSQQQQGQREPVHHRRRGAWGIGGGTDHVHTSASVAEYLRGRYTAERPGQSRAASTAAMACSRVVAK